MQPRGPWPNGRTKNGSEKVAGGQKFQVVKCSRWSKSLRSIEDKGHLVEADCPLGAISQAEMSWRQRKSVLVDTSPESREGHNTKHHIF